MRLFEITSNAVLYHTTSMYAAHEILKTRLINPKSPESFVSLSENPLPLGDIESKDCTIAFRAEAFIGQAIKVRYTEQWYVHHIEQAAYIAGEGWREQYSEPDDAYDDEGWADDDTLEAAYDDAQFSAFEDKSSEREYISIRQGTPLSFQTTDVFGIIVHNRFERNKTEEIKNELAEIGYSNIFIK